MYKIEAEEDGVITWASQYKDCVRAVHDFDKFKDSGNAKYERIITLTDPTGQKITKIFTAYSLV